MLQPKYMTEEELFIALGDFSLAMLETMGDSSKTEEERAKWLSHNVEHLTTRLWEELPLMRGKVTPSNN